MRYTTFTLRIAALTIAAALTAPLAVRAEAAPADVVPHAALKAPTLRLLQKTTKTEKEMQDDALRVIAEAADRVVSPQGIPSLLNMVALKDRTRLENDLKKGDAKKAADTLAAPAKEFGLIWRAKYKEGFDATENFGQLKGMKVELKNLNDREYAFIYFPAFGGWKPFEMHLTKSDAATWRIQLPDKVNGEQLAKDLSRDVAKLCADKDRWYGDKMMDYNSAVTQLVHAMSFESNEVAGKSGK